MWDWVVYGALIANVLVVLSALARLAAHVLVARRSLKRLRRHAAKELSRVGDLVETAAAKAARAGETELEASLTRLRRSLARVAVLREAVDEALALVPRL